MMDSIQIKTMMSNSYSKYVLSVVPGSLVPTSHSIFHSKVLILQRLATSPPWPRTAILPKKIPILRLGVILIFLPQLEELS